MDVGFGRAAALLFVHHIDYRVQPLTEHILRLHRSENPDQAGDQSGPSGLVAGSQAGAVVAVEIFVEENQVAPVWIVLEFSGASVDGAAAYRGAQESADETIGDFASHLKQGHLDSGAGGALHFKVIPVIAVHLEQRADQ